MTTCTYILVLAITKTIFSKVLSLLVNETITNYRSAVIQHN